MAFKIFRKTNYFYIIDTTTDIVSEGLAKDVRVKRAEIDSDEFSFENVNGIQPSDKYSFDDIQDENGDAYDDLATFVAWYEENTGFNVAGATALVTLSELTILIQNSQLKKGFTYEISGVQPFLYGGTTIWLQAISNNQLSEKGMGKFYVPKYDKEVEGYGIWLGKLFNAGLVDEPTYAINDKVIWGGKVWKNLTGNLGTEVDIFLLDDVNWQVIPFNEIDYNVEYDEIGYDIDNDCINYRKDKSNNEMSFSYNWWYKFENENFDGDMSNSKINPIKSFQWGNHFDYDLGKGNMTNVCNNSFIENINEAATFYNNTLENNGQIYSNTINNGTISSNALENNGQIRSNTINSGYISSNDLENSGAIDSNTINSGYINSNTLNNGQIYSNTLNNGYIVSNTLNNGQIRLGLTNIINNKIIQYLTVNTGDIGGDLGIDLSTATLVYADYERIVFKNSAGVTKIRYIDGSGNVVIADVDD